MATSTSAAAIATDTGANSAAVQAYNHHLRRLSEASIAKYYRAYQDVGWEDPAHALEPEDPRWEIRDVDPLKNTRWYRELPANLRAQVGLYRIALRMKKGVLFENVLQRGLLEFATTLREGAPEYRYAMHEVIEEGEHSMMFQEFINRTGFQLSASSVADRAMGSLVAMMGRFAPELFFVFAIGGEAPIDFDQRRSQKVEWERHPLLKRIERIHITEEARHLSFAESYLRARVPQLSRARFVALQVLSPIVLAYMFRAMLGVPEEVIRKFDAPRREIVRAYETDTALRDQTKEAFGRVRELCRDVGLLNAKTAWLWNFLGLE